MILGIDVGGTHTDAVLFDGNEILSIAKVTTRHENLVSSINDAIENVIAGIENIKLRQVNLSTTLSTNAIINNEIDPVGVLVSSGPGIDPESFKIGDNYYSVSGSIDHRGDEIVGIDSNEIDKIKQKFIDSGIKYFATVSKFSTRNSSHEIAISSQLENISNFTTFGFALSGTLNFPARISTAYYNSSVWKIYDSFANAIESSREKFKLPKEINILKADGGTITLEEARQIPVETILSGPAATVMGIMALCDIKEDFLVLDIGGTTTDISFFTNGSPVIEKDGATISDRKTLVRSLKTKSVGIGGDSQITVDEGRVSVGPQRVGASVAEGGESVTLVDVVNDLKDLKFGNYAKSTEEILTLSEKNNISADIIKNKSIQYAMEKIHKNTLELLTEINERPVYTIHEVLEDAKIEIEKIVIVGGPAKMLADDIKKIFNLPVVVPENFMVANAIGAALAKNTIEIELFADSSRGIKTIPRLKITDEIDINYDIDIAKDDAVSYLFEYCNNLGYDLSKDDIDIVEESSFNIIEGYGRSGRDIRVKCQIKPAVKYKFSDGGR